jgi:polyhydroxyalkanoate synthase
MALIPTPQDVLSRVRADVERETIRARNGIRVVTSTGRPPVGQSAKDVVWRRGRCELWRYRNENVRFTPPLFIVFSLVSRSYVLDLTPGNSFIEQLVGTGFDVFLLDLGRAGTIKQTAGTLQARCSTSTTIVPVSEPPDRRLPR